MRQEIVKRRINKTDQNISSRLKFLRLSRGVSQRQLGIAINVSAQQIQKYETGINRISGSNLNILAKFLKVEVSYFFESMALDKINIISDNIKEKEVLLLIKSYNIIKNEELRKIINKFIKSISLLNTVNNISI